MCLESEGGTRKAKVPCWHVSQDLQTFISRVPKNTGSLKSIHESIQDGWVEAMVLSPNPSPIEQVKKYVRPQTL